eukprot:1826991-Amphidinium_carterae.1
MLAARNVQHKGMIGRVGDSDIDEDVRLTEALQEYIRMVKRNASEQALQGYGLGFVVVSGDQRAVPAEQDTQLACEGHQGDGARSPVGW